MRTYLICESELRRFKQEYSTLTPSNTAKAEFFIKAWVSAVGDDRKTLKVIVADEKPSILFSEPAQIPRDARVPEADEHEAESRKDTLWGDLKLLTKKAVREGKHHLDHYQEVRAKSVVAPVNLTIVLTGPELASGVQPGEAYYFRVIADSNGLGGAGVIGQGVDFLLSLGGVVPFGVVADAVSAEAPELVVGWFADFIADRSRRYWLRFAVVLCVAIPGCVYVLHQSSESEKARSLKEAQANQLKAQADRRFDELTAKTESSMAQLKTELESRRDIGLLVDSDGVKWGGRGGPVTIHADGSWSEEKSYLALWPQSRWQAVSYGDRLTGLKTICGIWRRIWGVDANGEAEVRLYRDLNAPDEPPVGGCKRESDAWLSK